MTRQNLAAGAALILAAASALPALAQDNPLLAPAPESNPLLAEPTGEPTFEQQARAIDLAATRDSNDPVCQNIRTNYDQQLAKIVKKSGQSDGMSLSQIGQFDYSTRGTAYRINRINRNLTGDYSNGLSRTLGSASDKIGRGTQIAGDVAAIGGMLGIKGKSKEEKAREKAAKLDAQALDAVKQTGCPMSTFN